MSQGNKSHGNGSKRPENTAANTDVAVKGEPVVSAPANAMQRTFSYTKEVTVDLYKLLVAKVIKRTGLAYDINEAPSDFTGFEHTHPFRTFDSDGKRLTRSASIAGHYHIMTLGEPEAPGLAPPILEVSGPMRMNRKKIMGKWTVTDEPVNDYDTHSHDVEYIRSDRIMSRMTNIEAQKVIAYEAQKGASVQGVVPGGSR